MSALFSIELEDLEFLSQKNYFKSSKIIHWSKKLNVDVFYKFETFLVMQLID